jgi:hypothetical protein
MVIYPQNQYNTAAAAEAEPVPAFPAPWYKHGILVGKVLIKQGVTAPIEIQTAFDTQFGYALASDHGNLSGLADDDHSQYWADTTIGSRTGNYTTTGDVTADSLQLYGVANLGTSTDSADLYVHNGGGVWLYEAGDNFLCGAVCKDGAAEWEFKDDVNVGSSTDAENLYVWGNTTNSGTLQTGNITVGTGAAGVDYTITFNGEDNDGVITWLEDEDTFDMSCDLQVTSTSPEVVLNDSGSSTSTILRSTTNDNLQVKNKVYVKTSAGGALEIAHWKMNDNAASTTVVDSMGSYNGTFTPYNTNVRSFAGYAANTNTALNCNSDAYTDCGNVTSFDYNTPFSIALWCGGKSKCLISKLNATTNQGWEIYWSTTSSKIHLFLANSISGGTYIQRLTNANTSTSATHIVATYDGTGNRSGIKIYVNGVRADTTDSGAATLASTIIGSGQTLRLGSRNGSEIYAKGLDDIRIYDFELSQAQIDTIYNSGSGTEDPLTSGITYEYQEKTLISHVKNDTDVLSGGTMTIGASDVDLSLIGSSIEIGDTTVDGTLEVTGQTLFSDKVIFTQTDGNEYIDSLADGYLDLGATTGIRLTSPLTRITGDLYVGNNAAADPAIVFDGDTNDGQITYMEDEDYFTLSSVLKLPVLAGAPGTLVNGMVWAESDGVHAYIDGKEYILDMTEV